jgi:hypothetical protein
MLLVKKIFLIFLLRNKPCLHVKASLFIMNQQHLNSKLLSRPLERKVGTGRDLSLAYRWIQHSHSFKVYVLKIAPGPL